MNNPIRTHAGVICAALLTAWLIAPAADAASQKPETVVTATRTEERTTEAASAVTVITADEIRLSNAIDLAELFAVQTGASVVSTGPLGGLTSLRLRGSTTQEVIVLLDGVRLNAPGDGGFDLSALPVPLETVDRIEIVRGPASSLYGADGVAGIVQIFTRSPASVTTSLAGAYGEHGYSAYKLEGTSGSGSAAYGLFANKEQSSGYRTNSDYDRTNAGFSMKYAFDADSSLDLALTYLEKDIGLPGPETAPSPQARRLDRNELAWIAYSSRSSSVFRWKVTGSARNETSEFEDADQATSGSRDTTTESLEAQFTWALGSSNLITAGIEERDDKLSATDSGDHSASMQSFYLQDELRLGSSFVLVLGDRMDSPSAFGEQWSPRIAGLYTFRSSGTSVRASYGESYRLPGFNELYLPASSRTANGLTFTTQGNDGLVPETSQEYEAGIGQSLGSVGSIRLSLFRRRMKNQIFWQESQPDATTYESIPVNLERSHVSGYEAEAGFLVTDAVRLALNFIRTFPVDDSTGARLVSYAAPQPNMQAGGSVTMTIDQDTSLGFSGTWVDNYVREGDPHWSYYSFDGKIVETFISRKDLKVDFSLALRNLFNRSFETEKGFPMPPQELAGGVTARF